MTALERWALLYIRAAALDLAWCRRGGWIYRDLATQAAREVDERLSRAAGGPKQT